MFRKFFKKLETIRELEAMTDRELHDIGIRRSDIRRLVREAIQ
jgi:uncharacterized protein YjiS (DUF1127 family)